MGFPEAPDVETSDEANASSSGKFSLASLYGLFTSIRERTKSVNQNYQYSDVLLLNYKWKLQVKVFQEMLLY